MKSFDMPACELCGKTGSLFKAVVEGTELTVCRDCGGYGRILGALSSKQHVAAKKTIRTAEGPLEIIAEDFAERVRKARERLGLKQEELAVKIAEKESLIHKIESGKVQPPIAVARKLERFLKITLVETKEEEKFSTGVRKTDVAMTIGDLLKIKR